MTLGRSQVSVWPRLLTIGVVSFVRKGWVGEHRQGYMIPCAYLSGAYILATGMIWSSNIAGIF